MNRAPRHAIRAGLASIVIFGFLVWGDPVRGTNLKAVQVAGGLSSPDFATAVPGDSSRLFILEQGSGGTARIKILNLSNNTINPTPFLTLSGIATGGEQGLLGLAFDPNYATTGKFYIDFTASNGATHIVRFTVSANPNVANPTGTNVLTIAQPQDNHNGGWIGFSPRAGDSGNLYIAMGDGGNANDQGTGHIEPLGNAQNTDVLLGKMLRINVDTPAPGTSHPEYSVPSDNHFGNEVFTYGLRNPFRDSFDRQTGNLFIGDVGQVTREEVDVQKAANPGAGHGGTASSGGENYGWRLREGNIATPTGSPVVGGPVPADYVGPIIDYPRSTGQTVIGGYVYRGAAISSLHGTYIFGDYLGPNTGGGSKIFSLQYDGNTASGLTDITSQLFTGTGHSLRNVYSFGEDAGGELYIVDGTGGAVFRIIPEPSSLVLLILGGSLLAIVAHRSREIVRRRAEST